MNASNEPSAPAADAQQQLAEVLNRQREKFNARFLIARSRWRALSAGEWKIVLAESVAPIVTATAQALPDRAEAVAEAAYQTALELLARDELGPRARSAAMSLLWRDVLPLMVRIVASDPRRVLNRACNALLELRAHHLEEIWARRLHALALTGAFGACDAEQFERAIFALAWRCGLAHARLSALQHLRELPHDLARAIVGAPPTPPEISAEDASRSWSALLDRLQHEPFFNPSRDAAGVQSAGQERLEIVAQVGEWEAWGGSMAAPPRVARRRGALWAWSGSTWWRLHADAFGATLCPTRFDVAPDKLGPELAHDESCGSWKLQVQKVAAPDTAPGANPHSATEALQVTHGPNAAYSEAEAAVLRGFDSVLSAASDDHTLAFTSRLSMRIFIVARRAQ